MEGNKVLDLDFADLGNLGISIVAWDKGHAPEYFRELAK
jgi:hypothetical protein